MTDQWTPWITHTPGPCPVPVGTWVMTESICRSRGKIIEEFRLTPYLARRGNWFSDGTDEYTRVTRYRIRRPRGMQVLEEALKVKEVETV